MLPPTSSSLQRPSVLAICAVALAALLCAVESTSGDTLYDNGAPQDSFAPGGYEMTGWFEADDFTASEPLHVDGIKFWDLEYPTRFSGTVYWRIYANMAGDQPGAVVAEGLVTPSRERGRAVAPPQEEWVNTLAIAPVELPPGTYWLGLHNGPLTNTAPIPSMFWESTSQAGARPGQQNFGPDFNDDDWNSLVLPGTVSSSPPYLAFQLSGLFVPRSTALTRSNGVPQFSFTTHAGYTYRVEYKNALSDATWQPLPGNEMVSGNGTVVQVNDQGAGGVVRRFYRAVVL